MKNFFILIFIVISLNVLGQNRMNTKYLGKYTPIEFIQYNSNLNVSQDSIDGRRIKDVRWDIETKALTDFDMVIVTTTDSVQYKVSRLRVEKESIKVEDIIKRINQIIK